MPEIAEVARIVHHLRHSLVGKTIAKVAALDDANIFGKVGTSAAAFQKALTGKRVLDADQQGKYFWLILSCPPHPVFHFGMTGWIHIRGQQTFYYREEASTQERIWPPKFWKFTLETAGEPATEVAFTDARRFSRIRLVDCRGEDIRTLTPLKENGPDPVRDANLLTVEWLEEKMWGRKVPVKALLLDQGFVSGIGNWVGDEILYHAKLHPEQYSDTFSAAQVKQLHASMMYICNTAVDLLADSERYPEDWLFKHRWGKGKKDAPKALPTGEKIMFLTVGGRTSCVVPAVQRKTGPVAGEVKREDGVKDGDRPKAEGGRKRKSREGSVGNQEEATSKGSKRSETKDFLDDEHAAVVGAAEVKAKDNGKKKKHVVDSAKIDVDRRPESAGVDEDAELESNSRTKRRKNVEKMSGDGVEETLSARAHSRRRSERVAKYHGR